MTSTTWTETRDIGGILSPLATENPYWYNANHVFVPYCSSDSWSGSRAKPESRDSFRFMGSLIVRQVMADLIPLGLGNPQGADLVMAGSSAGGLGVMLNLDKVRTFLQDERGDKNNYFISKHVSEKRNSRSECSRQRYQRFRVVLGPRTFHAWGSCCG